MKICYVIEAMYNSGGMERVLSVVANTLCSKVEVSILTLYQNGRSFFFPVDNTIKRYDLEIEDISNKRLLKQRLQNFLCQNAFDIVISLGGIDMYYLPSMSKGSKKIVWFHFSFGFFLTGKKGIYRIKAYLQHLRQIYCARRYDRIVAISRTDCQCWEKWAGNTVLIPNPITIHPEFISNLLSLSAISVGRLDVQKGYNYLIKVWEIVNRKHPEWKLNIYGEGYQRENLQRMIDSLQLNQVVTLCGASNDIVSRYNESSLFVLTSITECFSLVLLEASACGLPLVAYDCPSGPRDIITDGKNGFLIKQVGDVKTFANRVVQLIEDEQLRRTFGHEAKLMSKRFLPENISCMWYRLLMSL